MVFLISLGNIIDGDSHGLGIDKQGWTLHAAVHEALPAIRCVIQLNTPATIAVSSSLRFSFIQKSGD